MGKHTRLKLKRQAEERRRAGAGQLAIPQSAVQPKLPLRLDDGLIIGCEYLAFSYLHWAAPSSASVVTAMHKLAIYFYNLNVVELKHEDQKAKLVKNLGALLIPQNQKLLFLLIVYHLCLDYGDDHALTERRLNQLQQYFLQQNYTEFVNEIAAISHEFVRLGLVCRKKVIQDNLKGKDSTCFNGLAAFYLKSARAMVDLVYRDSEKEAIKVVAILEKKSELNFAYMVASIYMLDRFVQVFQNLVSNTYNVAEPDSPLRVSPRKKLFYETLQGSRKKINDEFQWIVDEFLHADKFGLLRCDPVVIHTLISSLHQFSTLLNIMLSRYLTHPTDHFFDLEEKQALLFTTSSQQQCLDKLRMLMARANELDQKPEDITYVISRDPFGILADKELQELNQLSDQFSLTVQTAVARIPSPSAQTPIDTEGPKLEDRAILKGSKLAKQEEEQLAAAHRRKSRQAERQQQVLAMKVAATQQKQEARRLEIEEKKPDDAESDSPSSEEAASVADELSQSSTLAGYELVISRTTKKLQNPLYQARMSYRAGCFTVAIEYFCQVDGASLGYQDTLNLISSYLATQQNLAAEESVIRALAQFGKTAELLYFRFKTSMTKNDVLSCLTIAHEFINAIDMSPCYIVDTMVRLLLDVGSLQLFSLLNKLLVKYEPQDSGYWRLRWRQLKDLVKLYQCDPDEIDYAKYLPQAEMVTQFHMPLDQFMRIFSIADIRQMSEVQFYALLSYVTSGAHLYPLTSIKQLFSYWRCSKSFTLRWNVIQLSIELLENSSRDQVLSVLKKVDRLLEKSPESTHLMALKFRILHDSFAEQAEAYFSHLQVKFPGESHLLTKLQRIKGFQYEFDRASGPRNLVRNFFLRQRVFKGWQSYHNRSFPRKTPVIQDAQRLLLKLREIFGTQVILTFVGGFPRNTERFSDWDGIIISPWRAEQVADRLVGGAVIKGFHAMPPGMNSRLHDECYIAGTWNQFDVQFRIVQHSMDGKPKQILEQVLRKALPLNFDTQCLLLSARGQLKFFRPFPSSGKITSVEDSQKTAQNNWSIMFCIYKAMYLSRMPIDEGLMVAMTQFCRDGDIIAEYAPNHFRAVVTKHLQAGRALELATFLNQIYMLPRLFAGWAEQKNHPLIGSFVCAWVRASLSILSANEQSQPNQYVFEDFCSVFLLASVNLSETATHDGAALSADLIQRIDVKLLALLVNFKGMKDCEVPLTAAVTARARSPAFFALLSDCTKALHGADVFSTIYI